MKINEALETRIQEIVETGHCTLRDFAPHSHRIKFHSFVFDFEMDEKAKKMLEMAYNQLLLSRSQLERIERITKGIMALEKVTIAEACHIVEAIQYTQEDEPTNGDLI